MTIKCASCGQFAGKRHACPTPSTASVQTHKSLPTSNAAPSREDVVDRVAAAQEHIRLYHGTNQEIKGNKIHPVRQIDKWSSYYRQKVAFATSDISEARMFGDRVYEVELDEHSEPGWFDTYYSEKGFRIIREVTDE